MEFNQSLFESGQHIKIASNSWVISVALFDKQYVCVVSLILLGIFKKWANYFIKYKMDLRTTLFANLL